MRTAQANSAILCFRPAPGGAPHQVERLHRPASSHALAGEKIDASGGNRTVGIDHDHDRGWRGREMAHAVVKRIALSAPVQDMALDSFSTPGQWRRSSGRCSSSATTRSLSSPRSCGRTVAIAAAIPPASSCAGIRTTVVGAVPVPDRLILRDRPACRNDLRSEHRHRHEQQRRHGDQDAADDRGGDHPGVAAGRIAPSRNSSASLLAVTAIEWRATTRSCASSPMRARIDAVSPGILREHRPARARRRRARASHRGRTWAMPAT